MVLEKRIFVTFQAQELMSSDVNKLSFVLTTRFLRYYYSTRAEAENKKVFYAKP